jgi:hypothetical protein
VLQIVSLTATFERSGKVSKDASVNTLSLVSNDSAGQAVVGFFWVLWFCYPIWGLWRLFLRKQNAPDSRKNTCGRWFRKYSIFLVPPFFIITSLTISTITVNEVQKLNDIVLETYDTSANPAAHPNTTAFRNYIPYTFFPAQEDDRCEDNVPGLIALLDYQPRYTEVRFRDDVEDPTSCESLINAAFGPTCELPRFRKLCPASCGVCCFDDDELLRSYVKSYEAVGSISGALPDLGNFTCKDVAATGGCGGPQMNFCRASCRSECRTEELVAPEVPDLELTQEERQEIYDAQTFFLRVYAEFDEQLTVVSDFAGLHRLLELALLVSLTVMFVVVLHFHPNLGVISRTLLAAGSDLLFIVALFCILNLFFTLTAVKLFGDLVVEDDGYASTDVVFVHLFLAMVGEFDFNTLENSGAGFSNAVIFFLLHVVVFNLLLLNLILAIIVDAYADAKDAAATHPSVSDEISILATLYWTYWMVRYRGGAGAKKDILAFEDAVLERAFGHGQASEDEIILQELLPSQPTFLTEFVEKEALWRRLHDPDAADDSDSGDPVVQPLDVVKRARLHTNRRGSTRDDSNDTATQLIHLANMLSQGLLERVEFDAAKRQILGCGTEELDRNGSSIGRSHSNYIGGVYQ